MGWQGGVDKRAKAPHKLASLHVMWTINTMNNTDFSQTPREGTGELPAGRPLQTDFDTGLDYPRLGSVTFRRGTLTENLSLIHI